MKMPHDEELTKLKIANLQLVNFILGVTIISAAVYAIYRIGVAIWG